MKMIKDVLMKIQGLNHITIKISDLDQSLRFYVNALGMELVHRGSSDVYLEWGEVWICLVETTTHQLHQHNHTGVDHVAFSIREEDFDEAVETLQKEQIPIVRGPVKRGKGWSINFLDPDGTELELHTSNLHERMEVWD